jgi:hypothetical protein
MIHELRSYTLVPGKQGEYLKLAAGVGREARGDRYGTLAGHWYTEFGTLNQVVHLWSYADLGERARLRAELARNEDWTQRYLPHSRALTVTQENKILSPALPLAPPGDRGNVYELRWYRTHAGRAPDWIRLFQAVLPTREKYMRRVGLWQTEVGPLNEVVHLWAFRDLNERAAARAQLAQEPEWQSFLTSSLALLTQMQSVILMPSPHSPMQ